MNRIIKKIITANNNEETTLVLLKKYSSIIENMKNNLEELEDFIGNGEINDNRVLEYQLEDLEKVQESLSDVMHELKNEYDF